MASKLTRKQEQFCIELVECGNQTEAYRRAYAIKTMSDGACCIEAKRLVKNPLVALRIDALKGAIVEKAEIDGAALVKQLVEIAVADPNELVQHRRVCCRWCHGIAHAYQWKHRGEFQYRYEEWEEAARAWQESEAKRAEMTNSEPRRFRTAEPSDVGGFGFRANEEPHPECPECLGEGIDEVFVADTSKLTGPARRLYAGAKMTKHGVEIMMHSQDNARKLLGEHFGIFKAAAIDVNVRGAVAAAVLHTTNPDDIAAAYKKIMGG